jgi:hypothetical protein
MRMRTIVIGHVGAQEPAEVAFIEHEDVVEALAAQGPDQTFDIGILPRRPRGDPHLLDAQ